MHEPDSLRSATVSQNTPASLNSPRVTVVQDGARNHYATAIALHRAGILEEMFTHFFIKSGSGADWFFSLLKKMGIVRRANDRRCQELDKANVVQSYWLTARHRLQGRRNESADLSFERMATWTEHWITNHGFGAANALTGFVLNISHGLCAAAQRRGLITMADQMSAPSPVGRLEAATQAERWPDWGEPEDAARFARLHRTEQLTWQALDHITCASDYVRRGLLAEGVPSEKVSVIHYPIDETAVVFHDRCERTGPVVVGFLGRVSLAKGAPYFFEVAKRFDPREVRFVMVGPVHLPKSIVGKFAGNVEIIGGVPRSEVAAWLRRFDMMLFPSTCEGSSYALMEAMATGLPVVTSTNSGTVARHGKEGFIVPYDDVDAMAGYVRELAQDREHRFAMGRAAWRRCRELNLDYYSRELSALFHRLVRERKNNQSR